MIKNSEMLFIYDAMMCNPNGDPDDENRPRMDYERERNLVSDVRLKRYIRDYLQNKGYEIFVAKVEDKTVNATERLKILIKDNSKDINLNKIDEDGIQWLLSQLIDVRLFGATMPIKSEGSKGSSLTFTGPVQFNWGYSLNKVRLVDSSGITSHFGSEEGKTQGAMGKDYRVYYSLLAFHGIISGNRAKFTNLQEKDVELLDEALLKAIPLLATRSKIGQYPRLYLRVQYKDAETMLGDFRYHIKPDKVDGLRDVTDYKLDITKLKDNLTKNIEKIDKIFYWHDENLKIISEGEEKDIGDILNLKDNILEKLEY
jgi:CRISPR-associated protein Csh2